MSNEREQIAAVSNKIREFAEAADWLREYLSEFDFESIDECLAQIKSILALHQVGRDISVALESGLSDRFASAHLELCKVSGVVMPAMCGSATEASAHEAVFINAYRFVDDLIDRGFDYDVVNLDPMPYGEPSYRAESSFRERKAMVRAVAQKAHAIDLDETVVSLRQEQLQAIMSSSNDRQPPHPPTASHVTTDSSDVHLNPATFAAGKANLAHAVELAMGGNTAMRCFIVEAAAKLDSASPIDPNAKKLQGGNNEEEKPKIKLPKDRNQLELWNELVAKQGTKPDTKIADDFCSKIGESGITVGREILNQLKTARTRGEISDWKRR